MDGNASIWSSDNYNQESIRLCVEKLKEEFYNMEFSSIISKDKTWEKFKNTFKNLETEGQYL